MQDLKFNLCCAGVLGPGMSSLSDLYTACGGSGLAAAYTPLDFLAPSCLPPNERRRTSSVVRLVLACIDQAIASSPFPVESLRSVFATDDGIGEVSRQIFDVLCTTRQISPIVFSNSVHSAPAGYFSIATHNHQPATVISMGSESFASGLLCAVTDAVTLLRPVLFVSYDPIMEAPLNELLPISEPTVTAWVISAPFVGAKLSAIGVFKLTLELATVPPSELPGWIPKQWAANSSAHGFATLGLLKTPPGTRYLLALGKQNLVLEYLGCS